MSSRGDEGGGGGTGGGGCFLSGTKVSTPSGFVNIEDVKIGDVVHSWNEATKSVEESVVSKTMTHELSDAEIYSIGVDGGVVHSTGIHPFMLKLGDEYVWANA